MGKKEVEKKTSTKKEQNNIKETKKTQKTVKPKKETKIEKSLGEIEFDIEDI